MGKKRKNPQSAEASVKAIKVQKKQNSANGVLKERLVDIEIFDNQTGPEILNSFWLQKTRLKRGKLKI